MLSGLKTSQKYVKSENDIPNMDIHKIKNRFLFL